MPPETALAYKNRSGATYYLHQGRTKTGKPRYFVARSLGEGALRVMPEGFEFSESINGVVSVSRIAASASRVPPGDVEIVRAELARHHHLRRHAVSTVKDDIVVFKPIGGFDPDVLPRYARGTGSSVQEVTRRMEDALGSPRFDPVFKFTPNTAPKPIYCASRMSYRGRGGWLELECCGTLPQLARKFIPCIGTDEFFELW